MAGVALKDGAGIIQRIDNPGVGSLDSKTSGWTADSFSSGLEVDFSGVVPAGTHAVWAIVKQAGTASNVYARPSGDTNISNTPNADGHSESLILISSISQMKVLLWLSSDYKVQFAVSNTATNLFVRYPTEVVL